NYQTWAYLDTGSNFSAIKPSLVKTLGLTPVCPNNNSTSFIEKIKVFYNNITVHHKFEVFDLHSEADICIGLDLMPRLNIAVTGLITTWNDSTLPTIEDPIDPSPNTPSFEYFGTENIRNQFMNSIKRELDDNANIDPTSVCTIPNSEFKLAVSDNAVINKKQYPLALAYKPQLDAQLDTWLADKTIVVAEPHNPHNNPILFVKKRDDNGNYGNIVRVATDCRELNLSLIPSKSDNFALPRIEEIHEQLSHCQLFTVLDLKSCFTRFAIAKDFQPYTAFTTHRGQFQFAKACFGISTLPSFVQRMISNLFRDMPTVFCYIDDITIGSRTNNIHEHKKLVKDVIIRLNNAGLILQRKKCHFLLISLTLLGFKLSSKGLQIDSSKICNLDKLPPIINNKALMRVLGFFGYFRKFINNYSKISAPLDRLRNISDNALFRKTWNETHDKAYAGLKYAVTHAPVISVMDTSLPLRVSTDASGYAIGGYVWQIDRTNTIRFLGFASRSLTKSEKNYSTNKRECLAIAYMFLRYHQWLHLNKFILYTDHYSLIFLHTQRYCSALLQNWYTTIYSKTFEITYIKGSDNYIADGLSRLFASPEVEMELEQRALIKASNKSSHQIKNNIKTKEKNNSLLDQVRPNKLNSSCTELPVLRQRASELYDPITPPPEERRSIIERHHLLGHGGINAIELSIHDEHIHWTNLRKDIADVLRDCIICHSFNWSKTGFHPPKQIVPPGPGHHGVCDLGTLNITSESGNNFILIYVDLFTILRAIPDKEASTIAKQLTDRGLEFTNQLVEEVLTHLGVDHRLSLAYTPNSNGTNEAYVHSTKRTLIKKLQGVKSQWDTLLPATQLALNLKVSRLHHSTPFAVMFNRRANDFSNHTNVNPNFDQSSINSDAIAAKFKTVNEYLIPALTKRIQTTQAKDKARFMKTHKIITDKYPIGASNAKNLLSRDIPTSQIKLISTDNVKKQDASPSQDNNDFYEVQSIVSHKGSNPTNYLYRVRWKGYTTDDDTWEPASHFPDKTHIEKYWARRNSVISTGNQKLPKTVNIRHIPDRSERHEKRKSRRLDSTSPA
ncbi:hypothetical protein INT48_000427, partial [Thamnidium elegans]